MMVFKLVTFVSHSCDDSLAASLDTFMLIKVCPDDISKQQLDSQNLKLIRTHFWQLMGANQVWKSTLSMEPATIMIVYNWANINRSDQFPAI